MTILGVDLFLVLRSWIHSQMCPRCKRRQFIEVLLRPILIWMIMTLSTFNTHAHKCFDGVRQMIERHGFTSIESGSAVAWLIQLAARIHQLMCHLVIWLITSDGFFDPFREIARVMQLVTYILHSQKIGPIVVPVTVVAFGMK